MSERIQLYKVCDACNGTGIVYIHDWEYRSTAVSPVASPCKVCGGTGYEPTQYFFFRLEESGDSANKFTIKPGMENFESEPE
ncbi:MAG: hypothetical protein ACXABD_20895 [Candidatus Thorarchaeota archaeon]|jgi:excinuclease UvrABC ATPase subunit